MWTFSIGLVLVAGLIAQRENKTANRLLAVILCCAMYRHFALDWALVDIANREWILRSTFPGTLFAPPIFLLYARAMTQADFRLRRKDWIHFMPGVFGLAWFFTFSILNLEFVWENYVRLIILNLVKLPYIVVVVRMIWAFEDRMKNYTSDPGRTRVGLANALSFKPYILSDVIKNGLHTNFYNLVNGYRVERAKELLANPKSSHLNLFGVALESGFNSKSVFNDVFKKITQMTPSEYRAATINRETKMASIDSTMLYK